MVLLLLQSIGESSESVNNMYALNMNFDIYKISYSLFERKDNNIRSGVYRYRVNILKYQLCDKIFLSSFFFLNN